MGMVLQTGDLHFSPLLMDSQCGFRVLPAVRTGISEGGSSVTFLIAMTKYLLRSKVREEGLLSALGLKAYSLFRQLAVGSSVLHKCPMAVSLHLS